MSQHPKIKVISVRARPKNEELKQAVQPQAHVQAAGMLLRSCPISTIE